MNGNFEIDRAAYPYNGIRVGDTLKLYHVPTMQRLLDVNLPKEVSANAALLMNTKHHAWQAGDHKLIANLQSVKVNVSYAITNCVQDGTLSGPAATQLQQLVDAATA